MSKPKLVREKVKKLAPLKENGPSLFELANQLAVARGSVHFVDAEGKRTTPLQQHEFEHATQTVVAADVGELFGSRILVRLDDPDNAMANGLYTSQAHQTVKNTGKVIAVAKCLKGQVEKGDVVFWAGARSSDFPGNIPGLDNLVVLRFPEEVMGTVRQVVRVNRPTGAVEEERARLAGG